MCKINREPKFKSTQSRTRLGGAGRGVVVMVAWGITLGACSQNRNFDQILNQSREDTAIDHNLQNTFPIIRPHLIHHSESSKPNNAQLFKIARKPPPDLLSKAVLPLSLPPPGSSSTSRRHIHLPTLNRTRGHESLVPCQHPHRRARWGTHSDESGAVGGYRYKSSYIARARLGDVFFVQCHAAADVSSGR